MNANIIAAQLYTLRDFLKTETDIAKTLRKVKSLGFTAVQASGLGPIDAVELKKILDSEGLVCCATHESGADILERPEKVAEKLETLGCEYTAYPWPHTSPASEEDYRALAAALEKSGETLRKKGKTLAYHNHNVEFERFGNRTALDIIYQETSPEFLKAEIDTYWVQFGGCDPVEWCKKLRNRLPLLHLKEYGTLSGKPAMLEIGNGNLNWKQIVGAARESGANWFIIEQDFCRIDPFESLKISLEYLKSEI